MKQSIDLNKKKISIFLFVTLAVLILGYYFLSNNKTEELPFDETAEKYDINIKKPADWSNEKIAFPGYDNILVKRGEDRAAVALVNPEINHVYFKFTVVLKNTQKVLLETDLVKNGEAITSFKIPKGLKKDQYPLIIKIESFSKNDKQQLNGTEIETNLEVT